MRAYSIAMLAAFTVAAPSAMAQTLPQVIDLALQSHPQINSALRAVDSARESKKQVLAGFSWSADASGSASGRANWSTSASGVQTDSDSLGFGADVGASRNIWSGGRKGARIEQSDAQIVQNVEALRGTAQSIVLSAVQSYLDVRRDESVVATREANVRLLEEQLRATTARFEAGELTRTDSAQAQARLARSRADLASARAVLEQSRAAFTRVVGQAPGTLADPPQAPDLPKGLEAAFNEALESNPDILRLSASARAAQAAISSAKAELKPSASVRAGLSQSFDERLFDGARSTGLSVSSSVSVPLYSSGLRRSRIRSAEIDLARVQASIDDQRRVLIQTVTNAWANLTTTQAVIDASREEVKAAEIALKGTRLEYEVDLRTTLEVLNQEQELLNAKLSLIRAERDGYLASYALAAGLGRLAPPAEQLLGR